jgi:hypothetical protein
MLTSAKLQLLMLFTFLEVYGVYGDIMIFDRMNKTKSALYICCVWNSNEV